MSSGKSSRSSYGSASTPTSGSKEGFLKKKSTWSGWKTCWYVYEKPLLMEYKSQGSSKPVKVTLLPKCSLKLAESLTGSKYSFALFNEQEKDPLFLMASSEAEMVEWNSVLMGACKSHHLDYVSEDQNLLDAFNDAVIITSDTGTITGANETALELFGYTKSDFVGQPVAILMSSELAKQHPQLMKRYLDSGVKRLIGKPRPMKAYRSDGSDIDIVLSLGELNAGTGEKLKFIATIRRLETQPVEESSGDLESKMDEIISNSLQKVSQELKRSLLDSVFSPLLKDKESTRRMLETHSPRINRRDTVTEEDYEDIVITERLGGAGSGASVHSAYVNGWQCAVKEFQIGDLTNDEVLIIENEVKVLESLPSHRNLVRYLFHRKTKGISGPCMQIFMTRYSASLMDVIKRKKSESHLFNAKEVHHYCLEVARGLEALHSRNIIHRDLKSDNIFVVFDSRGEVDRLVIADFDTAKNLTSGVAAVTTVGTPGYIAPEVINSRGIYPYNSRSDVWSYGMLMFELMTLRRPFEEKNLFQVTSACEKAMSPSIERDIEAKYSKLIPLWKDCLSAEPQKRPTASDIKLYLMKNE